MNIKFYSDKYQKMVIGMDRIGLWDLTNYPNTVKNYDCHNQIDKIGLFRSQNRKKQDVYVEIELFNYKQLEKNKVENITAKIFVKIEPIIVEFYNQIVIRLIDYISIQISCLINEPEYLILYEQYHQDQEQYIEQLKEMKDRQLDYKSQQELVGELKYPCFVQLNIEMEGAELRLKSSPGCEDYICLTFGQLKMINMIKVYDSQGSLFRRVDAECIKQLLNMQIGVYEEVYDIQFSEMYIVQNYKEGNRKVIS